jgi:xanthine dehydrogenase accessory factor
MWDWLSKLTELRAEGGGALAVITVTACSGSTPVAVGSKMIVRANGEFFGTIGGGNFESLALTDAAKCIASGESRSFKYPLGATAGQCCGGVVEAFCEVIGLAPRLYLFGAGHVGQAVCRTLAGTAFEIHAIDEREEWIKSDALPRSVRRHACAWDEMIENTAWDASRTYVAIMTHRHDTDQEIVAAAIERPAKYIGLIGSQTKWRRFKERLVARGVSEEKLARVKCPIGIDVGGKAPQEVAVSVCAELLKTHYGR